MLRRKNLIMRKIFSDFVRKNYLLAIIVLIAAILRFIAIKDLPPSLNWDEVSHGYNAFSVLKTGKDEWGKTFPLIFQAYGDFKLPVYIYITAVSEFLFGLNAFAVRFPSVLAGIGMVFFTYLLVRELFESRGITLKFTQKNAESIALISSLFVAVEPWSLFLSRGAFEANLALFFFVSGMYSFLKSYKKPFYSILSTISFGLSVWTYNSYRIFTPIMLLVLFVIYRKEIIKVFISNRKLTTYYLSLTAILFIPMFWQLLHPIGQARYGRVAIIDDGAIAQIIEARNNSSLSPILTRFLYNRPTYFIQKFIENWASHFTCSFLFFKGGSNFQFSVPGQGLLYLINLPLFFIGFLHLIFKVLKEKNKEYLFVLAWLLIAPIPSSLTREAPHVLRAITILPVPMILSAIGINSLFNIRYSQFNKLRYILIFGYLIVLFINLKVYLQRYFIDYRSLYSWSWQYGYKEVVDYAKQNYNKYDKVVVSKIYGEPHEFFLFYSKWNPSFYQNDPNLIRFNQSNWYWVDRFDKFYFVNDWDIPKEEWESFKLESGTSFNCMGQKCLLVTNPENSPKTWSKLKTIDFLDGKSAFELYEN